MPCHNCNFDWFEDCFSIYLISVELGECCDNNYPSGNISYLTECWDNIWQCNIVTKTNIIINGEQSTHRVCWPRIIQAREPEHHKRIKYHNIATLSLSLNVGEIIVKILQGSQTFKMIFKFLSTKPNYVYLV